MDRCSNKPVKLLTALILLVISLPAMAQILTAEPQSYGPSEHEAALSEMTLADALQQNNMAALENAIALGSDLNAPLPDGRYPMLVAAQYANSKILERLVAEDVNLLISDDMGRNMMHYLAARGAIGNMQFISLLAPQLVTAHDTHSMTPLFFAYINHQWDAAKWMLEKGMGSLQGEARDGRPIIFHYVKHYDDPEALEVMEQHGLSLVQRNYRDQTLSEVARQAGNVKAAMWLQERFDAILDAYEKQLLEKLQREANTP